MRTLFISLLTALFLSSAVGADKDTRCYEMRVYYAAPGKLADLNARFRNHTCKLFEKHGMSNLGYWVPAENPENKLIYIIAHQSREAARQSWKNFGADPDWKAVVKASEANGRLVTKVESTFLEATDYSPAIQTSAGNAPRLFELRTYKAAPGKLDALNARFRQHTIGLFTKHGLTQVGYWTPMEKAKGAEDTLVYIVAHKNPEAADASWKAFRADPAWISVKKDSEVANNGSLTVKVDSVFMNPTDYSPTK